jgi:uncharacterized protein
MRKFLIFSILFLVVTSSSYGQENTADINRLANIIMSDSLIDHKIQNKLYFIKEEANNQIRGAGSKEKLATYLKFIDTQAAELLKTFSTVAVPQIYTSRFTPSEIQDLIVFYESPTGKNLRSEMNEIIASLRFESVESPQTFTIELPRENENELKEFYKTPTGKKFYKEMNMLIIELMTALSAKYIPDFQQKIKKELQRLDGKIWREAYRVKPEQITVYAGEFSHGKKLVRIVNDTIAQETYVTFAVPIYANKWWIRFDKNIELIDKDSNEHYQVLRLDKDFVLHKTMIVSDQKDKMIEVTLVFPLIKKIGHTIDLVETISDDADLMSNNNGGGDKSILTFTKVEN